MTLTARILSQGDELTTGATQDTNAGWLARFLWERGAWVLGIASAPDDLEAISRLYTEAARDCDLFVSTGGLGPTDDDYSAEAAAKTAGVGLREDADAARRVRAWFRRMNRPMPECNLKQARFPEGAEILENPVGTAPGFAMTIGRARAFFFPGVPRELYVMAEKHLAPWLVARGARPSLRRRFHCCGVGESTLQERLEGLRAPEGIRIGYKTWMPFNSVVLYGDPGVAAAADAMAGLGAEVRNRLGEDCFGEDEATLASVVGGLLQARGWTVGVAESCTAGMAAAMLTEVPGSSAWVRGGVVAYASGLKTGLLGVPEALLAAHGAVSEEVARAMAEGARRTAGADAGIGITGIAGPDGGTPEKPVGMVCFGLATPHETLARTVRYGDRGRALVRTLAAATALDWLRRRLAGGG
ncbi:MAG: CinA family nicotinamide mononucleotide deamidase-related protein [Planctomycetales bacterium]|nr:CinA family nicotinamide mononucleotide deamidase-related protein [Planctomycetales bacterium]